MKKLIMVIILVLIFILFFSSFSSADIYVKNMERTGAFEMMGKKHPEKVEIREQWLGKKQFAQFGEDMSIIIDYEKEKLYFVINKEKIYYEFPTDIDRAKLQEMLPPKIAEIIKSIKITDAKVNLSAQTKKIANWNCHANEFELVFMIPALNIMPKYKIRLWMTEDVPFDYKKYRGMNEFFEKFIIGILDIEENSKKEMEKLYEVDGFQVAAEITVYLFGSEINVESQCLEIEEKPAPAGIYSVPKDYTKKPIELLQKQPVEKHDTKAKKEPHS